MTTISRSIRRTKAFIAMHAIFCVVVIVNQVVQPETPLPVTLFVIASQLFVIITGVVTIRDLRRFVSQ